MMAWLLDGEFVPEPEFVKIMAVRWNAPESLAQEYIDTKWKPQMLCYTERT
jgi:hypothetical protein